MLPLGTNAGFEEVPRGVNEPAALSTSWTVNGMALNTASSLIRCVAILEIIGRSFTDVTLIVNVRVMVGFCTRPSFAVTVIVEEPLAFAAGVNRKTAFEVPGV